MMVVVLMSLRLTIVVVGRAGAGARARGRTGRIGGEKAFHIEIEQVQDIACWKCVGGWWRHGKGVLKLW